MLRWRAGQRTGAGYYFNVGTHEPYGSNNRRAHRGQIKQLGAAYENWSNRDRLYRAANGWTDLGVARGDTD